MALTGVAVVAAAGLAPTVSAIVASKKDSDSPRQTGKSTGATSGVAQAESTDASTAQVSEKLTLHHLDHSRSLRVLWLLEYLKLTYEVKLYRRGKDKLAPKELKEAHPLGHAPVLDIGEGESKRVLAESGAIMMSLVERYAPNSGLLPGTDRPDARYDVLYWLEYAEASIMSPLMYSVIFAQLPKRVPFFMRPPLSIVSLGTMTVFVKPLIKQHLSFVEAALAKSSGDWLCGKDLTLADFMMSFPLDGARKAFIETEKSRYPNLLAYLDRIEAEPSMKRAIERAGAPNDFSIFLK